MGEKLLSLLHSHCQLVENHKMLLLAFLFTCWGQHLLFAKIQVVTHPIPWRLNLREEWLQLPDSLCLERQPMHLTSSGVTEKWKTFYSLRVELGWLAKMKLEPTALMGSSLFRDKPEILRERRLCCMKGSTDTRVLRFQQNGNLRINRLCTYHEWK